MKRFLSRRSNEPELAAELRARRPEPREEFLASLSSRIEDDIRPRRTMAPRAALAAGLATAMLVAAASVGGLGYAATAARHAVVSVKSILTASDSTTSVEVRGLSAGGDQYEPGYSWGDPAHNHEGAPGLRRTGGAFAPPLVTSCRGSFARVSTRIVIDEQAVLGISVLGPHGRRLLLSQRGSNVGGALLGPQTRTLRYRVLVPRTLRISLRIPCSVLPGGHTYRIRVSATDPNGLTSTLLIPFWVRPATT